jgi:hypothetical protein
MHDKYDYLAIEEAWEQSNIAVLDSSPGSGKTTAITSFLKDKDLNHVIFVTPFLSEAEKELPQNKLKGMGYKYPKGGHGGKVHNLSDLIQWGDTSSGNRLHRITCTHSAYTRLKPESYDQLGMYTVVIDETLDVINSIDGAHDYTDYLLQGRGTVDQSNKRFKFNEDTWFEKYKNTEVEQYNKTRRVAKDLMYEICQMGINNQLYRYSSGNWFQMLPAELLTKAKRVIIMTHGFNNSFMHCWMKINGIQNSYINTKQLGLLSETILISQLRKNINFISIPRKFIELSQVRNHEILSKSHWGELENQGSIAELGKSLDSLIKEKMKAGKENIFWTAPKKLRTTIEKHTSRLRGKIKLEKKFELVESDFIDRDELDEQQNTVHSTWLPCNIKASNDFRHISNCLYAYSLNPPPDVLNLLTTGTGFCRNDILDTFKLNNLLQFIYRGSIRDNKPMNLCILPEHTEELLKKFLGLTV